MVKAVCAALLYSESLFLRVEERFFAGIHLEKRTIRLFLKYVDKQIKGQERI
jgi:hypothetical protein